VRFARRDYVVVTSTKTGTYPFVPAATCNELASACEFILIPPAFVGLAARPRAAALFRRQRLRSGLAGGTGSAGSEAGPDGALVSTSVADKSGGKTAP
jgi:hypothetical protein